MNSVEAYKGFITFLILGSIVLISVFGFRYVMQSSNTASKASETTVSEPLNVKTEPLKATDILIKWTTDRPTETKIRYSKNKDLDTYEEFLDENKTTSHEIGLYQLENNSKYYFIIINGGQEFPREGDPYTFETGQWKPIAPVIIEENTVNASETPVNSETEIQNNSNINPTQTQSQSPTSDLPGNSNSTGLSTDGGQTGQTQTGTDVQSDPNSSSNEESEYNGISNPIEYNPGNRTLGRSTSIIGQSITEEFKEAILYQDLRYDFDQNAKVDTNDYPLFIDFILNQE